MKLKTLKDLKSFEIGWLDVMRKMILKDHIKAEAIKWVKADTEDICDMLGIGNNLSERDFEIIDLVLCKFNNITSEDLK